jgi:secondary thiamine-phosphate synthase enzyme
MSVETHRIRVESQGHTQVLDITPKVRARLGDGKIRNGTVTLFVVGSTAALTTTEFEPGLANHDLRAAYERIAPEGGIYRHHETWGDDNGHSHVRAGLTGPSLVVPLVDGEMPLGTWQQIVLIDFDTRPRRREVIVQVLGEP